MHDRPYFVPLRHLLILAVALMGRNATAQSNVDPFVQLRGGLGDTLLPFNTDRGVVYGPDTWDLITGGSRRATYGSWVRTLSVPALPPELGADLPDAVGGRPGDTPGAAFEREIFYGGYAVVAGQSELSVRDAERVAAYAEARRQLLLEIATKFDELAGAKPEVRQAALAELAARQEGRLQALAAEAEAIRSELAWANSVFRFSIMPRFAAFRFDRTAPDFSRQFAAAYFYAGLSEEQRLLLTEMAYEAPPEAATEGAAAGVFFLPATARLRLPAGLPAALEEKIRAFAAAKASLKEELRAAVMRDDWFLTSTRTRRLAELAAQQAPRFAALEALAEEIRVGLAGRGLTNPPVTAALPADLTQRVGAFYARKVAVQRELLGRLRQLRTEHPASHFEIVRQGDGLAIARTGAEPLAGLAEFNAGLAARYAAFADESAGLRRDLRQYLERSPQRATRTVDQLANDFGKAYAALQNWDRYRNYSRAVLEPGLSPPQRRLLFNAAMWDLEHGGVAQP